MIWLGVWYPKNTSKSSHFILWFVNKFRPLVENNRIKKKVSYNINCIWEQIRIILRETKADNNDKL